MNIDNSNYDMVFEASLELMSLRLLNIVGEDDKIIEAKKIANQLVQPPITSPLKMFNIKASGNYGIALNSILTNKLIDGTAKHFTIALVSFWALSNHIKQDRLPLLVYNRAIVLHKFKDVFNKVYETVLKNELGDINTGLSRAILSSVNETINTLILFEVDSIKLESDYYFEAYSAFNNEYRSKVADIFGDKKYYNSSRKYFDEEVDKISSSIKNTFLYKL